MCGFIHDKMRVPSVCDLFTDAILRSKNMSKVYSEEELNALDKAMSEASEIYSEKKLAYVRGAALMIKKGFTGVADGRREPTVISVEGDTITCMEGDGIDKPFSISLAEAQEFYDVKDILSEEDMEAIGY